MKKHIYKIKNINEKNFKYVLEDKDNEMFYFIDDKKQATEYSRIELLETKERLFEFLRENKEYYQIESQEIR